MGIEPTTEAWEASVLPLNYIRIEFALIFYPISESKENTIGNVTIHSACDIIAHCAPIVPSIPLASANTTVFMPIGSAQ